MRLSSSWVLQVPLLSLRHTHLCSHDLTDEPSLEADEVQPCQGKHILPIVRLQAKPEIENDPGSPWRLINSGHGRVFSSLESATTIGELWDKSVRLFGRRDCFGTRQVLRVYNEQQPDGRMFEKVGLLDVYSFSSKLWARTSSTASTKSMTR